MLFITVPATELYNEKTESFVYIKEQTLQLEHSLVSVSKWESKWKKPFLNNRSKPQDRTREESIDYVRCMTITQNVNPLVYIAIDNNKAMMNQINDYINDSQTATWFGKEEGKGAGASRRVVTSELIYYWMISLQIPFECQKWHLNRLITLIKVCNVENQPAKKMSKQQLAKRNSDLNAKRIAASRNKKG